MPMELRPTIKGVSGLSFIDLFSIENFSNPSHIFIFLFSLSELLLKRNRFLKDNKVGVCLAGVIIFCEVMTEVGVQCGRVSAFKNRRMGQ